MSYFNEGDLENFILQDIDSSYSTWIESVIAMVENYIDTYCGTDFENSTPGDRIFDGSGTNEIIIGPVSSISAVKFIDGQGNVQNTLAEADWNLYPLNDSSKYILRLAPGGSYASFPDRDGSVQITGIYGSTAVPAAVKLAGIQLAARIINNGLRGGQVASETLGSYSVSYQKVDDEADAMGIKDILNQFRVMTLD